MDDRRKLMTPQRAAQLAEARRVARFAAAKRQCERIRDLDTGFTPEQNRELARIFAPDLPPAA